MLYHGSNVEVKTPEIKSIGYSKDFGYGFYCTAFEKQAKRWALTKRPGHVVSVYEYTPDSQLKVLSFPQMSEEWLDFVVHAVGACPMITMWLRDRWLMIQFGIMWKIL
jgi:hypothetical protein